MDADRHAAMICSHALSRLQYLKITAFVFINVTFPVHWLLAYLHQVRFQMRMVALVHTQVLIAIPVPNMENRLIFSTMRLGRFLMVHSGIGLLV